MQALLLGGGLEVQIGWEPALRSRQMIVWPPDVMKCIGNVSQARERADEEPAALEAPVRSTDRAATIRQARTSVASTTDHINRCGAGVSQISQKTLHFI